MLKHLFTSFVLTLALVTVSSAHASTEGCLDNGVKDSKRVAIEAFVDNLFKGNLAGASALLATDVKLVAHDELGLGGTFVGPQNLLGFYGNHMKHIQISSLTPIDWVCQNNRLVVIWDEAGKGVVSGKSFRANILQSWTFNEDGKVASEEIFWDSAVLGRVLQ
jgi:ketosteroid isomerase-like protein